MASYDNLRFKTKQLRDDSISSTKESWERGIMTENNVPSECREARGKESMSRKHLSDTHDHTKDNAGHARPGIGTGRGARGPPKWRRPKAPRPGVFLSKYETSEEEDAMIRGMRGESQEETMHMDIMAAVEAETDSILSDFGTEDLTKIVLITIKAAVPAIVRAVQEQLMASADSFKLDKNILESRYKEDELDQYSRKENVNSCLEPVSCYKFSFLT